MLSNTCRIRNVFLCLMLIFSSAQVLRADSLNLGLLMIDDTACPYCELWDEEIGYMYSRSQEGKLAPLIRHHYGEKIPNEIVLVSEPVVTPTFILLENNKERFRIEGYPGEEFFWSFLVEYILKIKKMKNN